MPPYVEIIGYVGSVLVAVSLMMSNILRLRVLNFIGAATFSAYGVLLHSLPVATLNGFIALVDVYFLVKLLGSKEVFELIRIERPDAAWPREFVHFYREDMARFFPVFEVDAPPQPPADLELAPEAEPQIVMMRRNMVPVGIFAYRHLANGDIWVDLDYVIPDYRDFKSAHFLYASPDVAGLAAGGAERLITQTSVKAHRRYLEKLGFAEEAKGTPALYSKHLDAAPARS